MMNAPLPVSAQSDLRRITPVSAWLTHCADADVPELERLARTIYSWHGELLAYFDTDRISNGPTEAVNLLIKKIKRVGHGFRTSTTTGCASCCTAASNERRDHRCRRRRPLTTRGLPRLRRRLHTRRPHRSLGRRTPAAAYLARPKATPAPGAPVAEPDARVRRDRIDTSGVITLRYNGRLHHIGIGRTHARTHVLLLIQDRHILVINEHTSELPTHA